MCAPGTGQLQSEGPFMAIKAVSRASYASDPDLSRGRRHPEPASRSRNPFRRDCDRIIHSNAFRRLKHKTQVFVYDEGDLYRTRLTHTLEVAQIARALARSLGLDEDLAEALALGHDLGHPPFGHAGERALDACLRAFGGFDHNAQTLRVVTELERRYPSFDGLNLTWETLEGLVKHNGPLTDRQGHPLGPYRDGGVPDIVSGYCRLQDLQLWSFASAEAQVAAFADDIAYDAHDIDDGLRAGLFGIDDIATVPLPGTIITEVRAAYPGLDPGRLVHEFIRRLIGLLIEDVVAETGRRLVELAPSSVDGIRLALAGVAGFSVAVGAAETEIKRFLEAGMYRHRRVKAIMNEAEQVVRDLFGHYSANPRDLPQEWQDGLDRGGAAGRARRIADFIGGMTDRYALAEHQRLFDLTPELR
jgi:dGTPase